jgi:DMSO reductase family type II enzyme heme b subunit
MKRLILRNRLKIALIIASLTGLWFLLRSSSALAGEPASPARQVSQGQAIYEERCAACHGLEGAGDGPAAERLFIKPRDFTRDEYKIKSTSGDEFPSRDDLIRVISEGMPGSSMPAWQGVLTQAEIGAVADYIQGFGRFFPQDGYGSSLIEIPPRIEASAESLAIGQELYASDIGCLKCHGTAGRGDGPSAFELTDNAGNVIYPADLTQPWTFRGGAEPEEIYLRLRTGLTGSPMPSFADALSEEDTWHLVNYILSFSPEGTPEPAVLLTSQFIDGPTPADPDDPIWAELPAAYFPLTAQLMRAPRLYHPSVNAVRVKSVYNASEVAFYVAWNDRTQTVEGEAVDALAIQFPQELSETDERPYFVFGDQNQTVYQWYWAADQDVAVERNGNGLNAIEVQSEEQGQTTVTAHYQDGRWQAVFRRPLQTGDSNDLAFTTDRFIPIAFMAWDGFTGEVDDQLGLTSWSVVYLQSPPPALQYAWIPGVMVAVLVAELALFWLARRAVRPSRQK